MKSLFTTAVLVLAVGFLMLSNPTVHDFSEYVSSKDSNAVTDLFSDLIVSNIEDNTTVNDYKIFTVFEYNDVRYLGIAYQIVSEQDVKDLAGQK